MTRRRAFLVCAFTLFVVFATHRVQAGGPWQLEGAGYGGSTTGHMACGSDVRVAYGGLGGELRYAEALGAKDRSGFGFEVGGTTQLQTEHAINCAGGACSAPEDGLLPFGRVRLGYDWHDFGFRIGALALTKTYAGRVEGIPFPDLDIRIGELDGARFVLGLGAYDLPTYALPGLYCGLTVPTGGGWEVGGHLGWHVSLSDVSTARESITLRAPLLEHLWARTDFALMENEYGPGSDVMIGLGGDL
jgi:hypothetical protein